MQRTEKVALNMSDMVQVLIRKTLVNMSDIVNKNTAHYIVLIIANSWKRKKRRHVTMDGFFFTRAMLCYGEDTDKNLTEKQFLCEKFFGEGAGGLHDIYWQVYKTPCWQYGPSPFLRFFHFMAHGWYCRYINIHYIMVITG